jgi:hypothetical protein
MPAEAMSPVSRSKAAVAERDNELAGKREASREYRNALLDAYQGRRILLIGLPNTIRAWL